MQKLGINTSAVKPSKVEKLATGAAGSDADDWSSDWTWETCSSSDEEGVDFVKKQDGSYSYSLPRYVACKLNKTL